MFTPVNHILAALGLEQMSFYEMNQRGDQILAAIQRHRWRVKKTWHEVEVEEKVRGRPALVSTVRVHINNPRPRQAGGYTVSTVTMLIMRLGPVFGDKRGRFTRSQGIALVRQAIELHLPMTESDRKAR